jgi:uncharacterized cupin superfamily protein
LVWLVSVRKVNVLTVDLDELLDEAGFRHAGASARDRLEARRIGASIYQADAGVPIWPYHYHHGIEEWLYTISGAPVLREPAGERTLTPGDLVCFPSGHRGAHTLAGPGRFVIFSTGDHLEPYVSVYPDSDKVSGPDGILLRSSAVGYWHGEGTGAADSVIPEREPLSTRRHLDRLTVLKQDERHQPDDNYAAPPRASRDAPSCPLRRVRGAGNRWPGWRCPLPKRPHVSPSAVPACAVGGGATRA